MENCEIEAGILPGRWAVARAYDKEDS